MATHMKRHHANVFESSEISKSKKLKVESNQCKTNPSTSSACPVGQLRLKEDVFCKKLAAKSTRLLHMICGHIVLSNLQDLKM